MKKPNIKTILVPIDFSNLSRGAIKTAKEIAERFDATIHLAHVHEFYFPPGFISPLPLSISSYCDDGPALRMRRLRMLAKKNCLAPNDCHLMSGAPTFNEICNLAREISADLLVMPTHGYTGLAHLFLGSTAERIVQHSSCPVLVTPGEKRAIQTASNGGANSSIGSILVPVDFSQSSFRALEYAIDFAERVAASLIVFHVLHLNEAFAADGYALYDFGRLIEASRKNAERQMEQFLRLAKFRRAKCETAIHIGSVASEICAFAKQRDVDLVITATHGLTGFKHLLIGSVAERVVRHAGRPVLVVPSHPEVRATTLTKEAQQHSAQAMSRTPRTRQVVRASVLQKRERKAVAHPFPETAPDKQVSRIAFGWTNSTKAQKRPVLASHAKQVARYLS
jgi:nucleotide-binding universal stress UspA family protein